MNAMIERDAIILLSIISFLLYARMKRWESTITRAVFVAVYAAILSGVAGENAMFLTRWSLILMLAVENIFNLYVELKKMYV